jgi:hypothetical protein
VGEQRRFTVKFLWLPRRLVAVRLKLALLPNRTCYIACLLRNSNENVLQSHWGTDSRHLPARARV